MKSVDRLEHYRQRYAALQPGWTPATYRYQTWVAERLTAEARVLDLGCGRGGIAERLHTTGRWVGTDPDINSLRGHRVPGFSRCLSFSRRLPFASVAFDVVVSSWVLEHLPEPEPIFAEIARVLRPGGRFFFLTPNARHPIPRLSRWVAGMTQLQKRIVSRAYGRASGDTFPVHYQANTPERIDRLAVEVGMRLVRVALVEDPAYLAWNDLSLRFAAGLTFALPPSWNVHLVGEYIRP